MPVQPHRDTLEVQAAAREPAPNPEESRHYVDEAAGRWVLLATVLASSMAFISSSALNFAIPALQTDLSATGTEIIWIVNATVLMLAAMILVGGALGDHYGRKRVFATGIVIFTGASVACGFAPNTGVLIAARFVQGIGGALMVPGSLAIISALFPPDRRGRAIGLWSSLATVTTLVGPVLGGWLAGQGLWRGVFFINLPLAAIALPVLLLRVPESRDASVANQRLDYVGGLLTILGLAGITYGFTELPNRGLGSPVILVTLFGGFAALIAFIIWEGRTAHPMMPLTFFRSRTFSGANLLTLFLYTSLGVTTFLGWNLIQVQGYPDETAALTFIPFTLLLTVLSPWAGSLIDKYGPRPPLIIGPLITGAGFIALALPGITGGPADFFVTYLPAILLMGVGMGITVAPLTTAVMGSVASSHAGTASGINNAVARTAQALALAILGAVLVGVFTGAVESRTAQIDGLPEDMQAIIMAEEAPRLGDAAAPEALSGEMADRVQQALDLAFVDGFRLVMLISAGLCFLSALMAFLLVEKELIPQEA